MLEVRHRFLVGSGRPSVLMWIRSAAALATMRPVLLFSFEESSAAVSKPRGVWLRLLVVQNLEEACRLPVRVQKQQAQKLAMNAA